MKSINDLKDIHKGKTCYIIGTGPSITALNADDFEDGFVIAINSSILAIEKLNLQVPVYCQYKDGNYPEPQCTVMSCDKCVKGQPAPSSATLLLHVHHAMNCFPEYEPRYFFDNEEYGLKINDFSQQSAIRNAELMGASNLVFYGFDSVTNGNCSKFAGISYPTAYAKQADRMKEFDYRLPYSYVHKSKKIEPIDLVYVLGSGSKWNDNELRFSLRSVEKHLQGVRNIVIVGEKPAFLQNVIHLPANDIFDPAVNADGNMIHKLLLACDMEGLSDHFLFMNDDFIINQPIIAAEVPTLHKGDMRDRKPDYWTEQFYRHRLKRTFDVLLERGEATFQYDYHAPMLMNRHDFKEVMKQYDYKEGIGYTFRSLYGNVMKVAAYHLKDQKKTIYKHYKLQEIIQLTQKPLFIGYNDHGLNQSFKQWMNLNFPDRSTYETTEIEDRVIEIANWLNGERDYRQGVDLFKKYLKGVNLIRMFEADKTESLRKKLEYKLEHSLDEY